MLQEISEVGEGFDMGRNEGDTRERLPDLEVQVGVHSKARLTIGIDRGNAATRQPEVGCGQNRPADRNAG